MQHFFPTEKLNQTGNIFFKHYQKSSQELKSSKQFVKSTHVKMEFPQKVHRKKAGIFFVPTESTTYLL